jgi:lysyl-tRNA synthetase class 2
MRRFLDERDFLEVETPALQPIYGGAFAKPFVTEHNALGMTLYLRISNELYLKRLIVGGLERVYEFSRNFRNEGIDRTHSPEFTMLELYQAFADVHDMMNITEALVADAVERAAGTMRVTYQGEELDFTPPWRRLSMIDSVSAKVGEPVDALDPRQLQRLADRHHIETRPGTGAGGLLDALFSELVQPELRQPTLVVDYPIETSPLARTSRTRPGVVERFELFIAGFEAQARALEAQMTRREQGDEEAQVMDADYVRALEYGMPPTGGVGIGIDRLVMLVTDSRTIREVILFPALRPEEGRAEIGDEPEAAAAPGDAGPGHSRS